MDLQLVPDGGSTRIAVGLKVAGVDKGYVKDYYTMHPYGTKWEVYGLQLDSVNVAYTSSGTVGDATTYINLYFYELTIARNNTSYGTVSSSSLIVQSGKTYSTSGATLTISDGRKVTASATSATGYTTKFSSWSPSSGTINAATTVTANFSRTANTYTITYNANGGSGAPAAQKYSYAASGTVTLSSTKPTRQYFTFLGWSTSSTATSATYSAGGTFNKSVASNTILYAVWKGDTYTITYNGNGATSGVTAASTHSYGVAKALTANGFAKKYKTAYTGATEYVSWKFKNWNTKADGSGTSYTNKQSVTNLGTKTLYAQWTFVSTTGVMGGSNDVNVRSGPGTSYENIGGSDDMTKVYAVKGASAKVIDAAKDSNGTVWLKVTVACRNLRVDEALGTKTGWVTSQFVNLDGQ